MAQRLYSKALKDFNQEVNNSALSESLLGLAKFLGKKSLKILKWDENRIAVPVKISVELPPLGNFEGIDIRNVEPILIVLDLKNYPTVAPKVFPDRISFPKDDLAHLYVATKNKPPAFCFVRGEPSEWYANKQLKDLVIRIENWLRDAATGELIEDGGQFDPLRLEGYSGTIVYDYDQLFSVVREKKSTFPNSNFAIALLQNISNNNISFKLKNLITVTNFKESFEELKKEREKDEDDPTKKYYCFGYVLWSDHLDPYKQYCVNLPSDWNSFKGFCKQHGIGLSALEEHIAKYNLGIVPIIAAINRPKKVIGFSGDIEFINFYLIVNSKDVEDNHIVNNIEVKFQSHQQPLSQKKAVEISAFTANLEKYSAVVGCGALGSKIVIHLARSGSTNFILIDPDHISPHNLVRHALFANSEGKNKAYALRDSIRQMYPYERLSILAIPLSGRDYLQKDILEGMSWIFDFTASYAFFYDLVNTETSQGLRICRAFISDSGNLGIIFFEGINRNPRIDDLLIMLYSQCSDHNFISSWLNRELSEDGPNLNINIGIGCNSETTVLSDDVVSFHGSYFSGVIKSETQNEARECGKIYLNEIIREPYFSNNITLLEIPQMVVLHPENESLWEIRIRPGIIEEMKREMGLAMPSETGGVLIGCANYKTKTIHVTELIKAPADSKANSICFFRGIEGLPEKVEEINTLSGKQLGYIGEWHTHPFGPNQMSSVDHNTVQKFKKEFNNLQTPLPVFLMIATPTHVLPYVF